MYQQVSTLSGERLFKKSSILHRRFRYFEGVS